MAIQARRGLNQDLDKNKLRPGEPATPLDTKELYVAFAPGDVKKIATYEDMVTDIENATQEIITNLTAGVNQATEDSQTATQAANVAAEHATTQGDYAKIQGDYAKEQGNAAQAIVLSKIADGTNPGIVKSGGDVTVGADGTMTVPNKLDKTGDSSNNTVGTIDAQETDTDIVANDKHSTIIGKIIKRFATLANLIAGKIDKTSIVQSAEISDATKVPSSVVTAAQATQISSLANTVAGINNNLAAVDCIISSVLSGSDIGNISAKKKNNRVILNMLIRATLPQPTAICVIDQKPSTSVYFTISATNDNVTYFTMGAYIDTAGNLGINIPPSLANLSIYYYISVSYDT